MEFEAEAFNLTNTPRFGNPAGSVSSTNFNADGSIKAVNNSMAITGASNERRLRVGFRSAF